MNRKSNLRTFLITISLLLPLASLTVWAEEMDFTPLKDNTIYEDSTLSNGQGDSIFAGINGGGGGNRIMRSLIAFDVSAIPPGSTINSASLKLSEESTRNHGTATVTLHRVTKDWGEGTSHASRGEAGGAPATTGDATWTHTFFDTDTWDVAGGDFSSASASESISENGTYTWDSTPELVSDVQGWLDDPSTNFGWILLGNESGSSVTSKQFVSKDGSGQMPTLTVNFTPPALTEVVDEFYFPLFADGSVPGILFQTSVILTNTGSDATVSLEAIGRDGSPLTIDMGAAGMGTAIEVPLGPGEAFSGQSSGQGDPTSGGLQLGYLVAKVMRESTSTMQDESSTDVGGTAVFTRTQPANQVILYEAGVPATRTLRDFTVFLDSLGVKDTGLAIVNPREDDGSPSSPAVLTLRVWDKSFQNQLGTAQTQIADGSAIGQFIWEIFRDAGATQDLIDQLQETEAVVTVESDQDLAAVTLRQNDDAAVNFPDEVPTLTAFPVIAGRADDGGSTNSQ